MKLWMILLGALAIYGIFFMWPIKYRIYKKSGKILSNVEMLELAKNGDQDTQKLKRMTRCFLILGVVFAVLFVLEKHNLIKMLL